MLMNFVPKLWNLWEILIQKPIASESSGKAWGSDVRGQTGFGGALTIRKNINI
jgi:hypothetical protein